MQFEYRPCFAFCSVLSCLMFLMLPSGGAAGTAAYSNPDQMTGKWLGFFSFIQIRLGWDEAGGSACMVTRFREAGILQS